MAILNNMAKLEKYFYVTGREKEYDMRHPPRQEDKDLKKRVLKGEVEDRTKWSDAGCLSHGGKKDKFEEPTRYTMMSISYVNKKFFSRLGEE